MKTRTMLVAALSAGAAVSAATPAAAQAWGPGRGEASLYVGYTNTFNKYHFTPTGEELDRGHTTTNVVVADLTYGLTDRLAVRVGLPYVSTRYEGAFGHNTTGHDLIDDGNFHGSITDMHLEIRYMALDGPLAVTPFLLGSKPVTGYEQHGHSAPGRQIDTATLGLAVGYRPERFLPRAYAQARYGFQLAEKVRGISHNASTVDLQVGYFVTSAISARVGSSWLIGHGGLPADPPFLRANGLFDIHDQVTDEHTHNMSVGLSWSLGSSFDVHATGARTFSGRNGHKIDRALSLGVSWSFTPGPLFGKKDPQVVSANP